MEADLEALFSEARDPETSFERLVKLVKHREVEVRRALLNNPNVCLVNDQGKLNCYLLKNLVEEFPEEVAAHPVFVLHALIEPTEEFKELVRTVAQRTTDVGLIERLWSTWGPSSWWVRQGVALNPKAPVDLLRLLGNKKTESEKYVRQCVALNTRTPEDVLRTLGNPRTEPEEMVRWMVAQNPNTPQDLLYSLGKEATEPKWKVRKGVALNPSTPEDLLRSLGNEATESNEDVRIVAQGTIWDRGQA